MGFFERIGLGGLVRAFQGKHDTELEPVLEGPNAVIWPEQEASITEHARFLLESKDYIANHPVPEDERGPAQYSHSKKSIADRDSTHEYDLTKPAITNCCYEHFEREFISVGWALFIEEAEILDDERGLNPAFNGLTFARSFEQLMQRYDIEARNENTFKLGHYYPANHRYIETIIQPEGKDRAHDMVEFYTRTDITNPKHFLDALDQYMRALGHPVNDQNGSELSDDLSV